MNSKSLEASPAKAVSEELDVLREEFRAALTAYGTRIETEIGDVHAAVLKLAAARKISAARLRDLRDMLTLLRKFSVKAEKGRRKDLKRIDSLVGDLNLVIESW